MGNKSLNERGEHLSNSLKNTGHVVSSRQAAASIEKYFEMSGTDRNDPEHVYGFVYGLNRVRDLLANIDKANERASDPEKKIVGLRFFKAYSKRENPDFKLKSDAYYEDLLVTPVYATGADYLKTADGEDVEDDDEDEIALAGARPCPNQCG